jgi:hypothetical protein
LVADEWPSGRAQFFADGYPALRCAKDGKRRIVLPGGVKGRQEIVNLFALDISVNQNLWQSLGNFARQI